MSPLDKFIEKSGHFFFRYRNLLFPVALVVLLLVSKPGTFPKSSIGSAVLTVVGMISVFAGQSFRLLVIGYAYIKRGGKDGKVFAERLVIRGFYAHSRNPMYVGNGLIVIGLALVYGSLAATFFIIPLFLFIYLAITVAEETYLAKQFGKEYDAYVKKVNRFIPNLAGLSESLKDFQYDWKRALRKDYGQVVQAAGIVLFLQYWKGYLHGTLTKSQLVFFGGCFVTLIAFYVCSRVLKKTGQLTSTD